MPTAPDADRPPYLLESVDAALQILTIVKERGEVRVLEVARELQIGRSTAHRLLRTLVWRDFLTQDRLGKAYRLGPVLVELSSDVLDGAARRNLMHPFLVDLAERVNETVNLIVREGASIRFLDAVAVDANAIAGARTGAVLPASAAAGGKVLLAWLSETERRALYPSGPPRLTAHSSADYEELAVELATVRQRGYAVNIEGSIPGLSAIAVPIRDDRGVPIAAIAISMPSEKFDTRAERSFVAPLLRCVAAIENELRNRQ